MSNRAEGRRCAGDDTKIGEGRLIWYRAVHCSSTSSFDKRGNDTKETDVAEVTDDVDERDETRDDDVARLDNDADAEYKVEADEAGDDQRPDWRNPVAVVRIGHGMGRGSAIKAAVRGGAVDGAGLAK